MASPYNLEHGHSRSVEESSTQKQARIRRERREAKIKAGGSARLDRITNLSGRPAEYALPPQPHTPSVIDPEEVDISKQPYNSSRAPYTPQLGEQSNEYQGLDLQQLLRGDLDMQNNSFALPEQEASRIADGIGAGEGLEDPMMQMLQQMMGGVGGVLGGLGEEAPAWGEGLPPGLTTMLSGGRLGEEARGKNTYSNLWKIIHALFAFSLGIYILGTFPFQGSRISRLPYTSSVNESTNIFWIFTTVELVLQSTRLFFERGIDTTPGMLGTIINILPMPWNRSAMLLLRYSSIYTTIVEDAMIVVFLLGSVAWWRGWVV